MARHNILMNAFIDCMNTALIKMNNTDQVSQAFTPSANENWSSESFLNSYAACTSERQRKTLFIYAFKEGSEGEIYNFVKGEIEANRI